ncbi:type II secretion system F family protein [Sphingomicrobium sediminis]|uniref:Type II secretion system F family protein n=1 Tax=Sphingomicrobium sediminis TaxID=2950949 RepID=A0A9X2EMD4_9SPHN|nr:type II secretion system F family protein [Sphingomicrobium sediminis]MCM8557957.1 type II secretion system F family protein [Sphingomicrobium sediminis]
MLDSLVDSNAARIAVLALVFIAVVIVTILIASRLGERREVRSRLAEETGGSVGVGTPRSTRLRGEENRGAWVDAVNRLEKAGINLVDTKNEGLRRKMVAAGYDSPSAPRIFNLIRILATFGLPLFLVLWVFITGSEMGLVGLYFVVVISALFGYVIPGLLLQVKVDRRQEEMVNGFPDALDLMLVCVEAGLGLETAFDRVGMEMMHSHPLLAHQFASVVLEMRAGRSREDALRRLADRAGVDEIRAFSTLLIQSQKLGSSVAATLRVYAAEMREKRRMRAEERAHRLPVLLSMPLVGCMLPVMVGVLMVPAVIRAIRTVIPALG